MLRRTIACLAISVALLTFDARAATNESSSIRYVLAELLAALHSPGFEDSNKHVGNASKALQGHDAQSMMRLTDAISSLVQSPATTETRPDWKFLLLLRDIYNFTSLLATKQEFSNDSTEIRAITKSIGSRLDGIQRQYQRLNREAGPDVIYQSEEIKDGARYIVKLQYDRSAHEVVAVYQPLDQSSVARSDPSSVLRSSPQMTSGDVSKPTFDQSLATTPNDTHLIYEVVVKDGAKFRPSPGGSDLRTGVEANPALALAPQGTRLSLIETKSLNGELWGLFAIQSQHHMPGQQGDAGWCLIKYFRQVTP